MGKEFVMGAKLTLRDSFSSQLGFIKRNTDQFGGSIRKVKAETESASHSMGLFASEGRKADNVLRQIAAAAMGAKGRLVGMHGAMMAVVGGLAVKKGFDWLVGGNANMEKYQNTLTVVMGSQQKAVEQLAWATKFAAKTPFEIPEVVEATVKMESYGLQAQKSLGIVGDMASVMGKSLNDAVEAVADAQTGELERLKEFGITKQMIQAQAKGLGSNPINNQGQITDTKAFNAALFSLMEKRFKGGMDIQSKSFLGMLSNAADFIGTMGRQLGKPLFDKFKAGLQGALDWAQKLKDSGRLDSLIANTQHFVAALWDVNWAIRNGVWAALKSMYMDAKPMLDWLGVNAWPPIRDGVKDVAGWFMTAGKWFIDNWEPIKPFIEGLIISFGTYAAVLGVVRIATQVWTAAQWLLNIALNANPIGLVVMGIGLLIGVIILVVQHWDLIRAKMRAVWQVFLDNPILWFIGGPITMLIGAIVGLIANWGHLKYSAGEVWDSIKNFFIDGANGAIDSINKLIDTINLIPGVDISHVGRMQRIQTDADIARMNLPDNFSRRMLNGTHATGLNRVPFDGYVAELHEGERVLTAAQSRRYNGALNTAPAAAPVAGGGVHIEKLVEKIELHATADTNGKELMDEFIHELYSRASEAVGILSQANMGALL